MESTELTRFDIRNSFRSRARRCGPPYLEVRVAQTKVTRRRRRASPRAPRPKLLPEPIQRLIVEEVGLEREAPVVRGVGSWAVHPGNRRPVGLDALGALVRHGRSVPALLGVEVLTGEPHDLVDVEQITLPRELAVPRALPRLVVDPQLDLAVQIVLVLRHTLEHPEFPLRQTRRRRGPGDALPVLQHVADALVVVVEHRPPAPAGEGLALDLAGDAVRIDQTQLLLVAGDLPGKVLRLAVEEEAVVLALVRSEESVRAVRGRHRAHATERRHVGPAQVALAGILEAIAERRGALDVGRRRGHGDELEGEA